ncbi:PIR Superfamily Protein [Plasmodium ovale wallikeri]|uniref:PIR Superfamily Protein n=2 Tax=Plasmodium ovale TaxID=36330 RepID=A0A1A9A7R5_PLAOA|nr:PIR Superfamily Protein [Plasmodium ovale curtisi]SBT52205.1 PIR Superfamily Protein [Plasmodium ovale wallikeri]SBT59327.1 PIR Superfamily Protein [Plasmodium ovale wallikeri]
MPEAKEEEYYVILSQLPGYVNTLNSNINNYFSRFNNEICKKFTKDNFNSNEIYINLCLGVFKFSQYLSQDTLPTADRSAWCKDLDYWLKNELKNIQDNECSNTCIYRKLKLIDPKNYYQINACENEIKDIKDSTFMNIEKLYTLYDNLNKYMNIFFTNDISLCDNAIECVNLYEHQITQCNPQSNNAICDALKKFKDDYNTQMKTDTKCIEVKKKLLYPETEEIAEEGRRYGEDNGLSDRQSSRENADTTDTVSSGSSTTFNIIIVVVVSLVVSKVLFILYKFEAFRSPINNPLQKMKNMWRNINERKNELPIFEQEPENTNFIERRYSIAYHSS